MVDPGLEYFHGLLAGALSRALGAKRTAADDEVRARSNLDAFYRQYPEVRQKPEQS
jgi:hypothetical protein